MTVGFTFMWWALTAADTTTETLADSPLSDPHLQRYVHSTLMQRESMRSVLTGTVNTGAVYLYKPKFTILELLLQSVFSPN